MKLAGSLAVSLLLSTFIAACAELAPDTGDGGADSGTGDSSYTVSGTISAQGGQSVNVVGVTVTLSGGGLATPRSTTTGADGKYAFGGVKSGSYTITPGKSGLTFDPSTLSVVVRTAHVLGQDFKAANLTVPSYVVSGKITGQDVGGVSLSLTNASSGQLAAPPVVSAADGSYSFTSVIAGTYKLQPSKANYKFTPTEQAVLVTNSNKVVADFVSSPDTFAVSGAITAQTGQNVSVGGIAVNLSGGALTSPITTSTGSDGKYSFATIKPGSYTITPAKTGLKFDPGSLPVVVSTAPITGQDFKAANLVDPTYVVSGKITGLDVSGVTLSLTNSSGQSAAPPVTSLADGSYSFAPVVAGTYKLQPSKLNYKFNPAEQQVIVTTSNKAASDFAISPDAFAVSGTITAQTGQNVSVGGIAVNLSGGALTSPITTSTGSDGKYSFATIKPGSYTITPAKTGLKFDPGSLPVVVSTAPITGQDFKAANLVDPTYVVSGKITGQDLGGVTLSLTNSSGQSAAPPVTSLADGSYSFAPVVAGSYKLQPSKLNYKFTPADQTVVVTTSNKIAAEFAISPDAFAVSGTITAQTGQSVSVQGIAVSLSGGALSSPMSATTGADGKYSFAMVKPGSYTITPAKTGLKFDPNSQSVTVSSAAITGQDFKAANLVDPTYVVSGKITGQDVSGVTLSLTNSSGQSAAPPVTSLADGSYSFAPVVAGTYKVQPSKADYKFSPAEQPVELTTSNKTAGDFAISPDAFTVSGSIVSASGQSVNVAGIPVSLSGGTLASPLNTTTGTDGKYTFSPKVKPGDYTVRPTKAELIFTPAQQTVVIPTTQADVIVAVPKFDAAATPFTCDTTGAWCRPSVAALTPALSKPIYRIWAASGNDLWFVGGSGTILRYSSPDAGEPAAWTQLDAGATNDLYAISGNDSSDVWVSGAVVNGLRAPAYHYTAGANPQWTTLPILEDDPKDINVLWIGAYSNAVMYGQCAGIVGTTNTMTRISDFTGFHIYGVWAVKGSDQWIVGRTIVRGGVSGPRGNEATSVRGVMARLLAGRTVWQRADSTTNTWWSAALATAATNGAWFGDIHGTGARDMWAVGTKGLVAHFDGTQWDVVDAGVGATNLYGVWAVSPNEVWFAGGDPVANTGKLFKVTDAGTKWTAQDITTLPGDAGVLYRVYVDSATNFIWVAGSGGIHRYKP